VTETLVTNQTQKNLEEIRTEANIILKVVDQFIKAGHLDEANEHLEKARMLDPTNAYVYAFQERIAFLREEVAKKSAAASNRKAMEDAARAKIEAERKRAEEVRLKKEAEQAKKLEEWYQKKLEAERRHEEELLRAVTGDKAAGSEAPPAPSPAPAKTDYVPPPRKMPAPARQNVPAPQIVPPPQNTAATKSGDQAYDMYKRVLMLAWADGAVSPEEDSQLRDLRTTLRITAEEHAKLEQEAKEESYAHAFTLVWTSGMSAKERSAVVSELRLKYQISSEAHSRIEAKVLAEFGTPQNKQIVYIIDDDENALEMIVRVLESGGFVVHAFNTSDEALTRLKSEAPDMIISDINLETSTIGGFSFYEKVRQLQHLSRVPFIFLSGMTDEGLVRYGKSLGADDYLTKPFSGDMLIDTIKGKLKRYKQLKIDQSG
jgi:CheY-like chemotaxis protein